MLHLRAHYAPAMRPLCIHYVSTPFWSEIAAPTMGPLCAHHAPTMRPLCILTILVFNRCAQNVPTMRPLCAHYAPAMCLNRFAVEVMGPTCEYYETVLG